jgi:hypothetical protein
LIEAIDGIALPAPAEHHFREPVLRESTSAVLELLVAPRFDDLGIFCVLILQEILTK